jgi:hypothetical protein
MKVVLARSEEFFGKNLRIVTHFFML